MSAPSYNDSDPDFELAERVRANQQRLTAALQPQYEQLYLLVRPSRKQSPAERNLLHDVARGDIAHDVFEIARRGLEAQRGQIMVGMAGRQVVHYRLQSMPYTVQISRELTVSSGCLASALLTLLSKPRKHRGARGCRS